MFYKFLIFALLFIQPVFANDLITPIDAQKNAQMHNSRGASYMKERDYLAAIKEFKIAIAINPYNQSTAVYYNNLGCAYMAIARIQKAHNLKGDFALWAQSSFENAIMQDCMNLTYYQNLVDSFELQNILNKGLKKYRAKSYKNPYDIIVVGLIYEKQGKKELARMIFDDFVSQNPDIIISQSLKNR